LCRKGTGEIAIFENKIQEDLISLTSGIQWKGGDIMKTITSIIMRKPIAILIVAVLCLTGLQACNSGDNNAKEVVSPTGCLKSNGRYFDPQTKTCVKVTSQQQALELDSYRYVNKLAEEGKPQEVEYRINLKTYVTVQKAEALWSELRDQGGKMLGFFGNLPDNYGYDVESGSQNPAGPKSWGSSEATTAGGCGWHHDFDVPPDSNTIEGMLLANIKTMEADTALGARPRPELRMAILKDGDCRIDSLWVIINPAVMRDFWNRHLNDIGGIQPLVDVLDKAVPAFGVQPFMEGE
jgi:hypothetical protein